MKLLAKGVLLIAVAALVYTAGWVHGVNTEIDAGNLAARANFEERCSLANLYVSGNLGDWSDVYSKIEAGTFKPVLMDATFSDGGDNHRASGVVDNLVKLEFLEPEQVLVLRNPKLIEKAAFVPIPSLTDGLVRTDCFHTKFPKLEQFVWSEST